MIHSHKQKQILNGIDLAEAVFHLSRRHNIRGQTFAYKLDDLVTHNSNLSQDPEQMLIAHEHLFQKLGLHESVEANDTLRRWNKTKIKYDNLFNKRHARATLMAFTTAFNTNNLTYEFESLQKFPKLEKTANHCIDILNEYLKHKDISKAAKDLHSLLSEKNHKIRFSSVGTGLSLIISGVLISYLSRNITKHAKYKENKSECDEFISYVLEAILAERRFDSDGKWRIVELSEIEKYENFSIDHTDSQGVVQNFNKILKSSESFFLSRTHLPANDFSEPLINWIDKNATLLSKKSTTDVYLSLDEFIREPENKKLVTEAANLQRYLLKSVDQSFFSKENNLLSNLVCAKTNKSQIHHSIARLLSFIPKMEANIPYASSKFTKNTTACIYEWCQDLIAHNNGDKKLIKSFIDAMQPTFERQELVKLCNAIPQKTLKLAL